MTVSSFFSFAELFSFMSDACATNDNNGYRQVPALLTFEDIIQVLVKAVNELCEPKVLPSSFDLSPRLLLISLDLFNMALKYVYVFFIINQVCLYTIKCILILSYGLFLD